MFGSHRGRHAAPARGPARLARLAVAALTATAAAMVAAPPALADGATNVLQYDQCANGSAHSTACPSGWTGNITNGTNSSYREGEVIPQRVLFTIPASTSTATHTISLHYDTLKGNVHTFDSLATWNVTQSTADRCQGLPTCVGGSPSSYPIPDDNVVVQPLGTGSSGSAVTASHMLPAGPQRQMVLYGGTITKIGVANHYGSGSGDEFAEQTVVFTVPASSSTQTLELLYGSHVANSNDWGTGEGAASSATTYQNGLVEVNGNAASTFINRVKNACQPPAPATYSLTKTPDAATVNAGDQIGFTITATSTGGSPVKAVSIDDALPTGTGLSWSEAPDTSACANAAGHLTCSFGDLAPGASASAHVVSGTSYDSPGTVTNTATSTSTNGGDHSSTGTVTVQKPSLTLTKTADASAVSAGQQIGFTINVGNGGPGTANGVSVTDALPTGAGLSWTLVSGPGCALTSGTLTCTYGSLASGQTRTVHVTSTTSSSTPSPVTNYVYLTAANAPSLQAHDSVVLNAPSLSILKTADAASVDAGSPIGFGITLTNNGPGTAYKAVIDDNLPSAPGVTWSVSPARAGCAITGSAPQKLHCDAGDLGTGSFTVRVASATTGATSGTLTNTATGKADNAGPVSSTATVTVKQPTITFSKKPDAGTVTSGDKAGWTVTVVNNGTGTATGLVISDPLPSLGGGAAWTLDQPTSCTLNAAQQVSCPVGNLAPGASFSVHLTGTTSPASGGSLYNKATLTGSNTVTTWADSTITVLQPVVVTKKTADATSVSSGDAVGFTVKATNTGNGDARSVVITDPLPGGLAWAVDVPASGCGISSATLTCTVGTLTPGSSFTAHVKATTAATTSGSLDNTATTTSSNAATSKGSASVTVLSPTTTLTKKADATSVDAGGQVGWVVTFANSGPGTARSVTMTDLLPTRPGIVWSIATPVAGCTMPTSVTVTCTRTALAPGESVTVHIVSATSTISCGDLGNTAQLDGANLATELIAKASTSVLCRPVLVVTKSSTCGQTTVPPGGLMSYTLTYSNVGSGQADNAVLVDTPDGSTTIATAPGATITHSPEKATWTLGALPSGASGSRVVVVRVGLSTGTITNTAALSDPNAVTATSSLSTKVDGTGADSRGFAYAADLRGLPIVPPIAVLPGIDPNIYKLGYTSSQAPGTPHDGGTNVIPPVSVPGLASVKLLAQTSHSSTDNGTARTQATSTIGAINLLGGAVTADAVKAVSTSSATALTAGSDALGSTVTNLVVNGNPVATVPGTSVNVQDPLNAASTIARLDILTVTPPDAGLTTGTWSSTQEVTALTLTLLKKTLLFPSGVVLKLAVAHSEAFYPSGLVCGSTPASVEGEAFTLSARGSLGGVDITTAKQGDVVLPATGGTAGNTVAANTLGTVLLTSSGTTSTSGDLTPNPHATANAHVENLSLLGGLVTAKALDVTATSTADNVTAGTSFAVTFTQLVVNGTPITLPVTPNTVIALPQPSGSVLYVVLDERTSSTTGASDTTGTVNAIHAYVLKGGTLTAEVIVSSAHSGAHTDHLV